MASSLRLVSCIVVVATILAGAEAETYTVLDSLGWTIPPGGQIAYRVWADKQDFMIGDTLVFNWTGDHTVARVPQSDYDNCTANNVIGSIQKTSPTNFTIDSNVTYFICTIENHCKLGQKVKISVGASAPSLITSALTTVLFALAISFFSHV
ncbi:hypothetical protein NMG60_11013248 [Bertholletia excelsa]